VVDADQSLAAQQRFPDQIGLITAAFYAPVVDARGTLGTGAGAKVKTRVDDASYLKPGNLLGVVHIRYGEQVPAE
jgi:hypothetical protein